MAHIPKSIYLTEEDNENLHRLFPKGFSSSDIVSVIRIGVAELEGGSLDALEQKRKELLEQLHSVSLQITKLELAQQQEAEKRQIIEKSKKSKKLMDVFYTNFGMCYSIQDRLKLVDLYLKDADYKDYVNDLTKIKKQLEKAHE